jgi:carboxylesterase type B
MVETVTVTVAQGDLRGKKVTAKAGTTYYSFQGIPYCKPPVGPLRFKVKLHVISTFSVSSFSCL